MRIRLLLLALLLAPAAAQAQSSVFVCIGPPSIGACQPVSATNPLPVSGTFTPSGTSPEFTPVAPATATAIKGVLQGIQYNSTQATFTDGQQGAAQATVRGAQIVATGADAFTVTGGGTAGTAATGVMTIQGITSMTPVQVSQATAANLNATVVGTGTFAVQATLPTTGTLAAGNGTVSVPSAESGVGIAPVGSAALESNHVIKASAGNFYGGYITTGATAGWLLLANSTTAPTAGGAAIAPLACVLAPANQTTSISAPGNIPLVFSTGITMVFSTSGCLTNTASTTAFFSGMAK